jgi:hypothetical protein
MKPINEKVIFRFKCGHRIWWEVNCQFVKLINDNDDCEWDVVLKADDKFKISSTIYTQAALVPTQTDIAHWLNSVFGHVIICSMSASKEID